MTKMPERIALSHAFGGLAAALVGVAEYYHRLGAGTSTASPWARSASRCSSASSRSPAA